MSLRSSASRAVVSTLAMSSARRAAEQWKARRAGREGLAATSAGAAVARDRACSSSKCGSIAGAGAVRYHIERRLRCMQLPSSLTP